MSKKILFLGAAPTQIPPLRYALDQGHHVITCDYLPENPGHKLAHESYNVSTTDNTATSALSYNDGAWHYLVATQGGDGMKLYVDNQLVGTNPQTGQQVYDGYWRLGGDTAWNGTAYFNGTIDEAAVYGTVLAPAKISAHYHASPVAPAGPVASFTSSVTNLSVSFDASASTSSGTITSFAWNFGDGATGAGLTTSHAYQNGGTYPVVLTITDSHGDTDEFSANVTVSPANVVPTAAFTLSSTNLTVSVDGSASHDTDGTISSYTWDFGDGSTGSGITTSHTYQFAGTYSITLTVTDNSGGHDDATNPVTVTPANKAPTASFTTSTNNLTAGFDGSGSVDQDGSIVSYAWTFGDGGTGSGVTTSHPYLSPGTYPITLKVTDNDGAVGTSTGSITVNGGFVVTDTFTRTATNQWGSADIGGTWTLTGTASRFSVNGSSGRMNLTASGVTNTAVLGAVSQGNTNMVIDTSVDKPGTGTGVYVTLIAHRVATSDYRLTERLLPGGVIHLSMSRIVNGTSTNLGEIVVSGVTYAAADVLNLRFKVIQNGASSTLTGKVWKAGTTEPANAQIPRQPIRHRILTRAPTSGRHKSRRTGSYTRRPIWPDQSSDKHTEYLVIA